MIVTGGSDYHGPVTRDSMGSVYLEGKYVYDFLDKINKNNLKKALDNIRYENDTKVFYNRKPFIVEISECNNEIDFNVLSLKEYEYRYGTWED